MPASSHDRLSGPYSPKPSPASGRRSTTPISTSELKRNLIEEARALGFDTVAVARPEAIAGAGEKLRRFIELGRHGTMGWMAERVAQRADPKSLWPDVRSIVMLGLNYGPSDDPLERLARPECGAISVYAQGDDYHDVVKSRLKALGRWLAARADAPMKVFVDTAPVMEKPLAEAAGIGWRGKHTNLVSREFGSWLFLGAIFTALDLPPDTAEADHCGSCRACLDICPTDAFPAPYQLDARRCISYLTIELKEQIPREFRDAIGNRVYGCDDCLAVCPWNKFARAGREARLSARLELGAPPLALLVELDDAAFRSLFRKSPVKRIGRDRFVRNVLVAMGNSGHAELAQATWRRLTDPSPLVRGMAVWALAKLLPREDFARLRREHLPSESESEVRAEWRAA